MFIRISFDMFVDEVKNRIGDYLLLYDVESVIIKKISKNNNKEYTGLTIVVKGENISPTIYLERYYQLYSLGKTIDEVLGILAADYEQARKRMTPFDEQLMEKDAAMPNVFMTLINYDKNAKLLNRCPHIRIMDLAVTFRLLFKSDENGIASSVITAALQQQWNITVDELYKIARINTRRLFEPKVCSLADMLSVQYPDVGDNDTGRMVYVLTNHKGINGAACILYDDILEEFGRIYGNFYILPSSIHEVLLMPDLPGQSVQALEEIVRDANEFVVKDEEFLSDSVYYYNISERSLTCH